MGARLTGMCTSWDLSNSDFLVVDVVAISNLFSGVELPSFI